MHGKKRQAIFSEMMVMTPVVSGVKNGDKLCAKLV